MSLKVYFFHFHLKFFNNLRAVSNEYRGQLHRNIYIFENIFRVLECEHVCRVLTFFHTKNLHLALQKERGHQMKVPMSLIYHFEHLLFYV